jgi:hypothetical protein
MSKAIPQYSSFGKSLFWHVYVLDLGYFTYDLGHRTGTAYYRTFRDVTQWTKTKAIKCGAFNYSIAVNAHRVTSMSLTDIDAVRKQKKAEYDKK